MARAHVRCPVCGGVYDGTPEGLRCHVRGKRHLRAQQMVSNAS